MTRKVHFSISSADTVARLSAAAGLLVFTINGAIEDIEDGLHTTLRKKYLSGLISFPRYRQIMIEY